MPDLAASLQTAKQAGYTDAQIADHLASDPGMGAQVATARKAGYSDAEIVGHLAGAGAPAPAPSENVFQKAGRLTAQAYQSADQAYRGDAAKFVKSPSLLNAGAAVLDAVGAATSPIKGIADATFGDKPVALPFGINSKGMTGGDIATFALPAAADLNALRTVGKAADAAGVTSRTMQSALDSSKGAASNALTAKGAAPAQNALRPGATTPAPPAPVTPAIKAAAPIVAQAKTDPTAAVEALRSAKSAAYKEVDAAGVQYTPEAFKAMVDGVGSDMSAASLNPTRHPKAASLLDDMKGMAAKGQSPSLTELDQLRQVVRRDVLKSPDEAERFFGQKIVDGIDHFVQSAKPGDVVGGDATAGAKTMTAARAANTQFRKAESITDAIDTAKRRASSSGSGGNADNAIRQELRKILEKGQNWTPDERAALTSAVSGGALQNTLRFAGKASPATGGLNSMLSIAATTASHGALGIPLMATSGAKFAADAMTNGNVTKLLKLVAAGGSKADLAAVEAWSARVQNAAKASPQVKASVSSRLKLAAAANPALVPLYQQSLKSLGPVPAAAATSQEPATQ